MDYLAATPRLSTTSYAILGLLAARPHTAYELAEQMQRAFDFIWPRARSGLYSEPKRLVGAGLAEVRHEHHGRRPRAVYSATAGGKAEFTRWLDESPAPAVIEAEAILRVMFADRGNKQQLLRTLQTMRRQALELQARAVAQGASYERDGPLHDRMHLIATGGRFVHEYATMLRRYAEWALDEVENWPSVGAAAAPRGQQILEDQLELFGESVQDHVSGSALTTAAPTGSRAPAGLESE
jgi:PadR family transcriptional regulator, regulatory protein AphA